jgi:hypothetical protein
MTISRLERGVHYDTALAIRLENLLAAQGDTQHAA